MNELKIVLASSSPRRKELLKKVVDNFEIISPNVTETDIGSPRQIAQKNAILKGEAVKCEDKLIIACDTLVALGDLVYGKPFTFDTAKNMLLALQGKTHSVFSGVYIRFGSKQSVFVEESLVTLHELDDEKICEYLNKFQPFDKAGSYGIQDGVVVKSYVGSYDNIMGLPTEHLKEVLREFYNVKKESSI